MINIKEICRKYGITNYTINLDGSIDVVGNVYLIHDGLTEIPLKFNKVSGDFDCNNNQLLKFNKVIGYFDCNNNQLTSLIGCPKEVGGDFYCSYNNLTSLDGCPKEVGGDFYCSYNNLTSLDGCPSHIGGEFYCYGNPLPKEIIDNPMAEIKRLNRESKLNLLLNEYL
jgi:hypothetical protein